VRKLNDLEKSNARAVFSSPITATKFLRG